ncbi:MAG: hemoglobin/transferrin/lactoferrin receptor protein [Maribacter sp.]|jgi:hemoglobin/transferrin/lactoferrin receptor protein
MLSFLHRFTITLSLLGLMLLLSTAAIGQNILVTIIDSNNETLIEATVTWGEGIGTTTDLDGTASVPRLNPQDIVSFSYTGYQTTDIFYEDLIKMNGLVVTLKESPNIITGIVVTAPTKFGERRNNLVNNMKIISARQMEEHAASTSADAMINAGIFVQKSQAGGGSPIIRGMEANKVLIVVDGVRMNNAIYRSGHLQNVITVDNAMLSHMEVLYGPSAVVYGSDALGGVLYMETKEPILTNLGNKEQKDTTQASAYVRYASASSTVSTHLDFGAGNEKFGSITSLTFTRFGDIVSGKRAPKWRGDSIPENWLRNQYVSIINGDDIVFDGTIRDVNPYLQNGTEYQQGSRIGYWQLDFLQKFKYRPSERVSHILSAQFSTSNNIQRYDQLSKIRNGKPRFAEWYYGPQKRILLSHTTKVLNKDGKLFDRALFVTAFQNIGEDRYQRKLNNLLLERNLEDVNVYSFNADFMKNLDSLETQTLFYGTEISYNTVRSRADFMNTSTNETLGGNPTRYGNAGNSMSNFAAYVNYRSDFLATDERGDKTINSPTLFRILAGLRYTYASTVANYEASSYAPELPFSRVAVRGSNITGALGLAFTPENWAFKASFATGFRVPNVDDLAKFREKDGFVTIPNPDLKPEYALNYELNVARTFKFGAEDKQGKKASSLTLSATVFYSHLLNAIVRKEHHLPTYTDTINGEPILVENDSTYDFDGTLADVVINTNAATADIFGYSLNIHLAIKDQFFINAGYNDIKGNYISGMIDNEEVTEKRPLSHIPPNYGQIGIAYQFKGKKGKSWKRFKAELVVRFNGKKPLGEYDKSSGNSDNLDDAIEILPLENDEVGTPQWQTWNIYTTWQFSRKFSLNFNVENIADLHYRPFSSGISAAGRNFIVTLKGTF